jgi:hypothetical protein
LINLLYLIKCDISLQFARMDVNWFIGFPQRNSKPWKVCTNSRNTNIKCDSQLSKNHKTTTSKVNLHSKQANPVIYCLHKLASYLLGHAAFTFKCFLNYWRETFRQNKRWSPLPSAGCCHSIYTTVKKHKTWNI